MHTYKNLVLTPVVVGAGGAVGPGGAGGSVGAGGDGADVLEVTKNKKIFYPSIPTRYIMTNK